MSGNSTSTTRSNQSNTFAPWVTDFGQGIMQQAGEQVVGNPWQPYQGQTSAGFGQTWGTSRDHLQSLMGQIDPNTQGAADSVNNLMGTLDPAKTVDQYMSPYTDQVLSPTLRNINEAARERGAQLGTEATMAGAFGDTAHGVQRALVERDRQRNVGDATAGAYDRAFSSAVGQRDSDLNRYLAGAGALANIAF
jgi:hypothetical protein